MGEMPAVKKPRLSSVDQCKLQAKLFDREITAILARFAVMWEQAK